MAKVNGKEFDITSLQNPTIRGLLQDMQIERMVAVEVNNEVIEPEKFIDFQLSQQDEIEVIQFVGGG